MNENKGFDENIKKDDEQQNCRQEPYIKKEDCAQEPVSEYESRGSGEYSYTKEALPKQAYMDAAYQTKQEAANAPRSYYTPPEKVEKPKKEKKQKAEGKGFWVKIIAACLVCALLGGVGGGAIVASQMPEQNTSGGSSLTVAQPSGGNVSIVPVVSGDTLTGSQIYQLGCNQTVGITTEITYTNVFGMKTSAPVSGSGFIATSDGYIVTNYHVVRDAYLGGYDISVMLYNGETYPAKIVGTEEQADVAVLKIEANNLSAVTFGSSGSILVGETVYAIGNPLGELSFSMSTGSVSALNREITTVDEYTKREITNTMFQIDAAVNEGNSGGPVYNSKGEVVGIVTAKYADTGVEGLGFAIPIDEALNIINEIIKNGYVSGKAYFGISVRTVESTVAQYYDMKEGVYVGGVEEGSCSEKAGLLKGDIITALNDTEIKTVNDLNNAKSEYKAGDTVTLTVFRNGETTKITLTFDEEAPPSAVNKESDNGEGENKTLPAVPKG